MITIDPETNKVEVSSDSLQLIANNVATSGADRIAIVSVMGAYRTGKSFLLDLFLRHLRYKRKIHHSLANDQSLRNADASATESITSGVTPVWLTHDGDSIVEGTGGQTGEKGFQWRGGMEKCTQGIWIWSEPFVIEDQDSESAGSGEKIAILLLDSQGAFDSQMTKEQSATVFGLTAVLSSLQIYNVSMQLQEDKIESLHYFMECAGSCVRLLEGDRAAETKLFQRLEFLVRDWPHFEADWSVERCEAQMAEHLRQHFDNARDKATPEAIRSMFENVSCWMLPHPGLKINKVGWDGRIADLNEDFLKFLDEYVKRVFSRRLKARTILGKPLTSSTFVPVIKAFVEAFVDLVPKGANLATAIARSSNLMSKEEAISLFKVEMEKGIESGHSKGLKADDLVKLEKRCRASALDRFIKQTGFGPVEERESVKEDLVGELDRLRLYFENENRRKMESALTIFAGLSVVAILLYGLDKISDFTCDWYSDTCVRISNALFLIYFTIIVAILTNAYLLYQSRGQAVAFVALIEMGKSAVTLFGEYVSSVRAIFADWRKSEGDALKDDIARLGRRVTEDIQQGVKAIHSSVSSMLSGSSRDSS